MKTNQVALTALIIGCVIAGLSEVSQAGCRVYLGPGDCRLHYPAMGWGGDCDLVNPVLENCEGVKSPGHATSKTMTQIGNGIWWGGVIDVGGWAYYPDHRDTRHGMVQVNCGHRNHSNKSWITQ